MTTVSLLKPTQQVGFPDTFLRTFRWKMYLSNCPMERCGRTTGRELR